MMKEKTFEIKPFILLGVWLMFMSFCLDTTAESLKSIEYFVMLISVCVLVFMFKDKFEISDIMILLLIGVILRSSYVLYTAVWTRQHDVIDFGAEEGHAAYIEYIFHNSSLPLGDPRERWAFFQPPLHHIIAAVWMKVCNRLGLAYRQVQENVQVLTLFYTSVTMFMSYFACRELKLKKEGMRLAMVIIAFHPSFIIMSGSINNDALSLMFSAIAFYLVILWYQNPKFLYIVMLAFAIGLSMFAKLSGGLIAPAVAILFLMKFVDSFKMKKDGLHGKDGIIRLNTAKCFIQYIVFGIIVFPLGIWWEIRNMLSFGMPFNYIPPVGEQLSVSMIRRIFDVRMHSVYPSMIQNGDAYDEYNVLLTMIKTSLFDDANLGNEAGIITPFAVVLFIAALGLVILALWATVKLVIEMIGHKDYSELTPMWAKVLLLVYYASMLAGFFSFALGSSNYSAMNFRYITMAIVVEAIILGIYIDKSAVNKLFKTVSIIISYIFAAASCVVYILLGFAR